MTAARTGQRMHLRRLPTRLSACLAVGLAALTISGTTAVDDGDGVSVFVEISPQDTPSLNPVITARPSEPIKPTSDGPPSPSRLTPSGIPTSARASQDAPGNGGDALGFTGSSAAWLGAVSAGLLVAGTVIRRNRSRASMSRTP